MAISGRPILDDFDDPVQALTDGIGQGSVDEGQDVDEVSTQCADERAQCGNATAQGSGHPGPGLPDHHVDRADAEVNAAALGGRHPSSPRRSG